jgi:hypothetical protein
MDPNQTLDNIRALARDLGSVYWHTQYEELADELVEQVQHLDEWLTRGGFPPDDWNHHHTR